MDCMKQSCAPLITQDGGNLMMGIDPALQEVVITYRQSLLQPMVAFGKPILKASWVGWMLNNEL